MKKSIQYNIDNIEQVIRAFALDVDKVPVVTLTGGLGAGKTTIVGSLLRHWGVGEPVSSPTFAYVNIYELCDGRIAYHFDLYRLKNLSEFEAAGFFEYLDQPNSVVLIEWPQIVESALLGNVCRVYLEVLGSKERLITYEIENKNG
ncbi:MAG: tRNA (adenosine(37)-N6)-threonylcarbamoyltransferase complex ATPase subunit type 1 TsaE [Candidatus Dependentiae bacterium]|nr:tRNA (adenosine(37)-N6)-threonylcarbamoyltransferase complex ATPase subunit type 1 TsaE [Candidatus Dependentiae bacterium]